MKALHLLLVISKLDFSYILHLPNRVFLEKVKLTDRDLGLCVNHEKMQSFPYLPKEIHLFS